MPLLVTTFSECMGSASPEPDFLLPGLLPRGVPGILAAAPGWGKTTLAIQMSAAVATGQPCLSILPTGGSGLVLFVELESSPQLIGRRLAAWLSRIPEVDREIVRELLDSNFRILAPDYSQEFLPGEVMGLDLPGLLDSNGICTGDIRLVVVDTLSAISSGDENAVEPARALWAQVQQVVAMTGATVLLLHHTAKAQFTPKGHRLDQMSPEAVRGSSAHLAAARFVMQGAQVTSRTAPRQSQDHPDACLACLGLTKLNDGPMPERLAVMRSSETLGFWNLAGGTVGAEMTHGPSRPPNKMTLLLLASIKILEADGCVDRKKLEEAASRIGMDFRSAKRNLVLAGWMDDDCQPTKQGLQFGAQYR